MQIGTVPWVHNKPEEHTFYNKNYSTRDKPDGHYSEHRHHIRDWHLFEWRRVLAHVPRSRQPEVLQAGHDARLQQLLHQLVDDPLGLLQALGDGQVLGPPVDVQVQQRYQRTRLGALREKQPVDVGVRHHTGLGGAPAALTAQVQSDVALPGLSPPVQLALVRVAALLPVVQDGVPRLDGEHPVRLLGELLQTGDGAVHGGHSQVGDEVGRVVGVDQDTKSPTGDGDDASGSRSRRAGPALVHQRHEAEEETRVPRHVADRPPVLGFRVVEAEGDPQDDRRHEQESQNHPPDVSVQRFQESAEHTGRKLWNRLRPLAYVERRSILRHRDGVQKVHHRPAVGLNLKPDETDICPAVRQLSHNPRPGAVLSDTAVAAQAAERLQHIADVELAGDRLPQLVEEAVVGVRPVVLSLDVHVRRVVDGDQAQLAAGRLVTGVLHRLFRPAPAHWHQTAVEIHGRQGGRV